MAENLTLVLTKELGQPGYRCHPIDRPQRWDRGDTDQLAIGKWMLGYGQGKDYNVNVVYQ